MSVAIHPSAVVDPAATLGADVSIGPFCIVGPDVALGDGVRLESHVVVQGRTRIYESLVKGDNSLQAGTPQSFYVLMKEMQSLCLDIKLGDQDPLASAFAN